MADTPLLKIENLEVRYGAVEALKGVSIHVNAGEVVTIIGGNGAGKSTLMKTISGLEPAAAGHVMFEGHDITRMPGYQRVALGVAQSPEGRQVFPDQTVRDNLLLGAYHRKASAAELEADLQAQFETFPRLRERQEQPAGTMSGGEQQMLAIGRALMTNPHLLVLDEATEGLAPLVREDIWRCLHTLRDEGQSILVIDKYVQKLVKLADQHTIIERGQVVWQGASAALEADHNLWHRYIGV